MKPPICEVCGEDFGPEEGGLVEFERTPSDMAWYQRAELEEGFVGHPPNVAWFCGEHIEGARRLEDGPLSDALQKLAE